MRIFVKLFLMLTLAAPASAQYAPAAWPGPGWPMPWPQFVWVPVLPPYFMWPVPQWPAMALPYPAEALTWPEQPVPFPALPDLASGSQTPGMASMPDASTAPPAVQPDAPKPEKPLAMTEMPASPPTASVRPVLAPAAKSAVEASKPKPRPKAKQPTLGAAKPKAKPRRLCWNNGVVDACPK